VRDLNLLKQIEARSRDPKFVSSWEHIKTENKIKLSHEVSQLREMLELCPA
jgi:hypothetical protein